MATHLKAIRENRQKWFEVAETLAPGITKERIPGSPASQEQHAQAQALISDLRRAGIDIEAALDSSTGNLSPFDTWKPLPNSELGAEIWQVFIEVKQPENPSSLARPLKNR
jgi:hypothetical protein